MSVIWLCRLYCSWLPIAIWMIHIRVAWLIHICVAWLIYVWNDSCIYEWYDSFIRVWHDSFTRVWYDFCICKKHDSSTRVWLEWVDTTAATATGVMSHSYICAMTHSHVGDITWTMMVTWLMHDSFTHGTWLMHDSFTHDSCMTLSHMTHAWLFHTRGTCLTTHACMCIWEEYDSLIYVYDSFI